MILATNLDLSAELWIQLILREKDISVLAGKKKNYASTHTHTHKNLATFFPSGEIK